jgi:MYXO-CTERM domain-containing protein
VEPVANSFDVGRVVSSGPALYWVGESLRGPGTPSGCELAAIGGNASVPELVPGPLGSAPGAVTPLPDGAGVVFHAWTADHGRELWVSERSTGRTERVCDFQPGPTPGIPDGSNLAVSDDAVYAMAFVEGVGTEPVEIPMAVIRSDVECGVGVAGEIREDAPLAPSGDPAGCSCRTHPDVGTAGPIAALAIVGAALSSRRRRAGSRS